jgi:two-component system CheB/CheR fusion protein
MTDTSVNGDDLEKLLEFVKRSRRFDFTGYKRMTLQRRIAKRMQEVGCASYADYQDFLEVYPNEYTEFFNTLLINVTSFFRDGTAWEFLSDEVVPRMLSGKERGAPIRVWSAGCATGEEAYTLAMVLAEALGVEQFRDRVKIYGTDVDDDALARARQAAYTARDLESLSPRLIETYFEPTTGSYTFRKDLRRSVIFGRHDLVQDAPISRLDLLVCRNTLMYFNAETQATVLQRFHFALGKGGFLFLGKAEALQTQSALFRPTELRLRIFHKADGDARHRLPSPSIRSDGETVVEPQSIRTTLRDVALDEVPVPLLVVDVNGTVGMVNEPGRALFGITGRDVGSPLQDLEASYRPIELRAIIEEAYAARQAAHRRLVPWNTPEGERVYDVSATPLLDSSGTALGAAVTFTDVTQHQELQSQLEHSNRELETAYEELQSTNEELETTNEELQSTVEELETTNEELQSTNEELETTNEELQSTNDELQYVNDEAQRRGDELTQLNSSFRAIMGSLEQAVVVLDQQLVVQVWNGRSEDFWGLRSDEVVGKSFLGLDIGLDIDQLWAPVRGCLDGVSDEVAVALPARNRRGRAFMCRVRCLPFRLDGASPEGVVVVMDEQPGDGEAGTPAPRSAHRVSGDGNT